MKWTTLNRLDTCLSELWFHWISGEVLLVDSVPSLEFLLVDWNHGSNRSRTAGISVKALKCSSPRRPTLYYPCTKEKCLNTCKRHPRFWSCSQAKLPLRKITSKRRDVDIDKLEVSGDIWKWSGKKREDIIYKKRLVGIYRGDLA